MNEMNDRPDPRNSEHCGGSTVRGLAGVVIERPKYNLKSRELGASTGPTPGKIQYSNGRIDGCLPRLKACQIPYGCRVGDLLYDLDIVTVCRTHVRMHGLEALHSTNHTKDSAHTHSDSDS